MISKVLLALAAAAFAGVLGGWMKGSAALAGPCLVATFVLLAAFCRTKPNLKGFQFTMWVFAFVAASMFYPFLFIEWGGYELKRLIVPLIQVIMFGMGTSLAVSDFARVLKVPKAVGVCMLLQFTVMPLTGWALTKIFGFEGDVAAGVVLIGSCSAGVASNVMVYLAKGSLALGVTMTTASTLMAPVMTPLAMKVLAGQYVPINFWEMMREIILMIILPVLGGLIVNRLRGQHGRWLDGALPVVSMGGICFIIAIITALSRDKLLEVGGLLILAAMLHNFTGYLLGYHGARLLGLDEIAARTVSFEVGLQNGGMASGLAINVLKSSDAALAAAIFGPWMNISGSALASYWRRKAIAAEELERARQAGVTAEEKPVGKH